MRTSELNFKLMREALANIEQEIVYLEAKEAKPESCASGCSPAGCGGDLSEAGRSPDRQIVAKLRTIIKGEHDSVDDFPVDVGYADGARDAYKTVLQYLEEIDKGEAVPESQDAMEEG